MKLQTKGHITALKNILRKCLDEVLGPAPKMSKTHEMYSPSDPDESENLRIYIIANMPFSPLKMFFIVVKRS